MNDVAPPSTRGYGSINSAAKIIIVDNPPADFKNLDVGTIVKGEVIAQLDGGKVQIKTQEGIIELAAKQYLATGSQVSLEVKSVGSQLSVVLLSTQPPKVMPVDEQIIITPQRSEIALPPLEVGDTVRAILTPTSTQQSAPQQQPIFTQPLLPIAEENIQSPQLPQTQQLTQQPQTPQSANPAQPAPQATSGQTAPSYQANPSLPSSAAPLPQAPQSATAAFPTTISISPKGMLAGAPTPATPRPDTQMAGKPAVNPTLFAQEMGARNTPPPLRITPSAPTQAAGIQSLAATGPEALQLRIIDIIPPQSFSTAAVSPDKLTGIVLGQTKDGVTLLQTSDGLLRLPQSPPVATGTKMIFDIIQKLPMAIQQPVVAMPPETSLATLTSRWDNLEQAVHSLSQGQQFTSLANNAYLLPPTDKLPAMMITMMQALKNGDMKSWLGEKASRLAEALGDDAANNIGKEFRSLSQLAQGSTNADWKAFIMPYYDEEAIKQMRFFVRTHGDGGKNQGGEDQQGTRFIVELNLSRVGDLQIDGLIRNKRFDLTLRSKAAFTEIMKNDIRTIFENAQAIGDLKGQLVFAVNDKFNLNPLSEVLQTADIVSI